MQVQFGGVLNGIHDRELAVDRVDDARSIVDRLHILFLNEVLQRRGEEFRGKIWYQKLPRKTKAPKSSIQHPKKLQGPNLNAQTLF